jgi:Leucine rich repeat
MSSSLSLKEEGGERAIEPEEETEAATELGRQLRHRLEVVFQSPVLGRGDSISLPLGAVQWLLQPPFQNNARRRDYSWPRCLHLRITADPWPGPLRIPSRRPLRSVFPQLRSVWFDSGCFSNDGLLLFLNLEGVRVLRIDGANQVRRTQHRVLLPRSEDAVLLVPPLILASSLPPDPSSGPPEEEEEEESPMLLRVLESSTLSFDRASLTHFRLSHCDVTTQDAVWAAALDQCLHLRHLDLSHNRLTTLSRAPYHLGNLCRLNVAHNDLTTLAGIDCLPSLQWLNGQHNRLTDLHEAASRLAHLPLLKELFLFPGNPWRWDDRGDPSWSATTPHPSVATTDRFLETGAVLVWQARLERRPWSGRPTLREVWDADPGLPRIDGAAPSARQWQQLRQRVARPVPIPPRAATRRLRRARRRHGTTATTTTVSLRASEPLPPRFTVGDVLNALVQKEEEEETLHAADGADVDPAVGLEDDDENGVALRKESDPAHRWSDDDLDENIGQLYLASIPRRNSQESSFDAAASHSTTRNARESAGAAVDGSSMDKKEAENVPPADASTLCSNGDTGIGMLSSDLVFPGPYPAQDAAFPRESVETVDPGTPEPNVVWATPEKALAAHNGVDASSLPEPFSASSSSVGGALPSPISPTHTPTLTLRVSSFSESQWTEEVSFLSTPRNSNHTPGVSKSRPTERRPSLVPPTATYDGPRNYRQLRILDNLELYFRLFVFAASDIVNEEENWQDLSQTYPRIQLWPIDRARRDEIRRQKAAQLLQFDISNVRGIGEHWSPREMFHRVWTEKVVACGKAALRRLTPSRSARYGFHGELLWSAADTSHMRPEVAVECRETICCLSDSFLYFIANHDTVTSKPMKDPKRDFPLPIPESACFQDAKWPHALACHALESLNRITIGFGFQRLTLYFQDAKTSESFVYILLTCNKLETIALLKLLQELTSLEAETAFRPSIDTSNIRIENDDPLVLDALVSAVVPDTVGVVLHYQIVQQRWKSGGRGTVRRVCVVTDSKLYLLDEDYIGDGAESIEAHGSVAVTHRTAQLGACLHRFVDSADLHQIAYLQPADSEANAVTIVMKPASALKRRHHWRLVCRDGRQGAERLVDDVRKAISNL